VSSWSIGCDWTRTKPAAELARKKRGHVVGRSARFPQGAFVHDDDDRPFVVVVVVVVVVGRLATAAAPASSLVAHSSTTPRARSIGRRRRRGRRGAGLCDHGSVSFAMQVAAMQSSSSRPTAPPTTR